MIYIIYKEYFTIILPPIFLQISCLILLKLYFSLYITNDILIAIYHEILNLSIICKLWIYLFPWKVGRFLINSYFSLSKINFYVCIIKFNMNHKILAIQFVNTSMIEVYPSYGRLVLVYIYFQSLLHLDMTSTATFIYIPISKGKPQTKFFFSGQPT